MTANEAGLGAQTTGKNCCAVIISRCTIQLCFAFLSSHCLRRFEASRLRQQKDVAHRAPRQHVLQQTVGARISGGRQRQTLVTQQISVRALWVRAEGTTADELRAFLL